MSMLCDVGKIVQRFQDTRDKFYGIASTELYFAKCTLSQKAKVRLKALIEFNCSGILIDQVFLISSQLVSDILLGMDYCISNQAIIDFPRRKLILKEDEEGNKTEVASVDVVKLPMKQVTFLK
jgi:hypothetical protein